MHPRFPLPRRAALPLLLTAAALAAGCSRGEADRAAAPAVSAAAPQAKAVGVVTLKAERLPFTTELAGRTVAPVVAQIRPQVGGIVQKRLFTEGAMVKAGQVLYQLDPVSFEASAASAAANVRRAETTLANARSVARRNAELAKIDAVSQQVAEQSQAAAEQAEAELAVARAAEQTARINLARTRITAPISGWIELSNVTAGALVTADQATPLTTIQQLDPLNVHVTQSSAELLRLKRELASGRLTRGRTDEAPIRLLLEDGTEYPHAGRLTFSGVTVDAGTGSVTLRAVVPNPERTLMPGMYVRAVLQEGVTEDAVLVPQQGVVRDANGGASALVVGPDDKLVRREVVLGRAVGNRWQVVSGLAAGDRVLVEGSQRARAGDRVRATEVAPAANGKGGAGPGPVASAADAVPPTPLAR